MQIRKNINKNTKMKVIGKNTVEWTAEREKFIGKKTGERTFEWEIMEPEKKTIFEKAKKIISKMKGNYIKKHNKAVREVFNKLKEEKVPLDILNRKDLLDRINLEVEVYRPNLILNNPILVKKISNKLINIMKENKLI